jgi:hypothetical protein
MFIDCKLAGTDLRRVKLKGRTIRGALLDGNLGVDYLRGVTMPWVDVVDSAGALAAALGINVEPTLAIQPFPTGYTQHSAIALVSARNAGLPLALTQASD